MNWLTEIQQHPHSIQEYVSEFVPLSAKANTLYKLAQHLSLCSLNNKYQDLVILDSAGILDKLSTRNFVHHITTTLIAKDSVT
jgi:hypothetical protein